MAKTPKKSETSESAPEQRQKPLECLVAGRLGLGVAVVRSVLSMATPENVAAVRKAFETGSAFLAEIYNGVMNPTPKKPPEESKPE